MASMLWTGPDGITRSIQIPDTGAPDFIAGPPMNVYKTGLPVPVQGPPHVGVDPEILGGQYQINGFPEQVPNAPTRFGSPKTSFGPGPKYTGTGSGGAGEEALATAGADVGTATKAGKILKGLAGNPLKAGAGGALAAITIANALMGKDGYQPTPGPGPIDDSFRAGQGLLDEAGNPNTSPAMSAVGNTVGSALQMPGRIYKGIGDAGSAVKSGFQDAFTPQGVLDQRKADAAGQGGGPLNQDNIDSVLASVTGGLGGDVRSTPIDLGAAPRYDVPNLPLPDESTKANYRGIQAMVDQLRPERLDNTDLENTRGMAVLAGIAAGLVNSDSRNFGQTLLQMGVGALAGQATIDEAENVAKEKFKDSMKEYITLSMKVAQAQNESDAEYSQRVYETKLKQATTQWEADKLNTEARAPKLIKLDNGKLALQTVNPAGENQLQVISDAGSQRFSRIETALVNNGVDPKIAKTTASLAMGASPADELPLRAVGGMRSRGQTQRILQTIGSLGPEGKKVVEQYNAFGMQTALNPNKEEGEREALASQDIYLANVLRQKPKLLVQALQAAGEDPNLINLYITGLQTANKPKGK